MSDTLLVLNAGSSSVKFQLFAAESHLPLLASGATDGIGTAPTFHAFGNGVPNIKQTLSEKATQEDGLKAIIGWIEGHISVWQIKAVVHRIVHGGEEFTAPIRMTSDIFHRLKKLIPLAPLHQPHNLAAIGIAERLLPHCLQIACFDTAFHATRDALFTAFALPRTLREKGVKRYGFHGLSYEWIAYLLRRDHPDLAKGRIVAAHLGNGASLCAMKEGKSVDTTMGMTALDGLPMGTRSGAIDAGAVLYMIQELGLGPDKVEHILYEESGLKGLSGLDNDVKKLLESNEPAAQFALAYFTLKIAQYMAMMGVSIGGIDGIIFTGGIGENASSIREAVVKHLNLPAAVRVLVIPANEERMMAMRAFALIEETNS